MGAFSTRDAGILPCITSKYGEDVNVRLKGLVKLRPRFWKHEVGLQTLRKWRGYEKLRGASVGMASSVVMFILSVQANSVMGKRQDRKTPTFVHNSHAPLVGFKNACASARRSKVESQVVQLETHRPVRVHPISREHDIDAMEKWLNYSHDETRSLFQLPKALLPEFHALVNLAPDRKRSVEFKSPETPHVTLRRKNRVSETAAWSDGSGK